MLVSVGRRTHRFVGPIVGRTSEGRRFCQQARTFDVHARNEQRSYQSAKTAILTADWQKARSDANRNMQFCQIFISGIVALSRFRTLYCLPSGTAALSRFRMLYCLPNGTVTLSRFRTPYCLPSGTATLSRFRTPYRLPSGTAALSCFRTHYCLPSGTAALSCFRTHYCLPSGTAVSSCFRRDKKRVSVETDTLEKISHECAIPYCCSLKIRMATSRIFGSSSVTTPPSGPAS